jgi:hypothetical protein
MALKSYHEGLAGGQISLFKFDAAQYQNGKTATKAVKSILQGEDAVIYWLQDLATGLCRGLLNSAAAVFVEPNLRSRADKFVIGVAAAGVYELRIDSLKSVVRHLALSADFDATSADLELFKPSATAIGELKKLHSFLRAHEEMLNKTLAFLKEKSAEFVHHRQVAVSMKGYEQGHISWGPDLLLFRVNSRDRMGIPGIVHQDFWTNELSGVFYSLREQSFIDVLPQNKFPRGFSKGRISEGDLAEKLLLQLLNKNIFEGHDEIWSEVQALVKAKLADKSEASFCKVLFRCQQLVLFGRTMRSLMKPLLGDTKMQVGDLIIMDGDLIHSTPKETSGIRCLMYATLYKDAGAIHNDDHEVHEKENADALQYRTADIVIRMAGFTQRVLNSEKNLMAKISQLFSKTQDNTLPLSMKKLKDMRNKDELLMALTFPLAGVMASYVHAETQAGCEFDYKHLFFAGLNSEVLGFPVSNNVTKWFFYTGFERALGILSKAAALSTSAPRPALTQHTAAASSHVVIKKEKIQGDQEDPDPDDQAAAALKRRHQSSKDVNTRKRPSHSETESSAKLVERKSPRKVIETEKKKS